MAAGILNIEIDQGATFTKRLYFLNKRIVTAIVSPIVVSLVGSDEVTFDANGVGTIQVGDYVMFGKHSNPKMYKNVGTALDLSIGGVLTIDKPLEEVVNGNAVTVMYPVDLTNAEFHSQIRSASNSDEVVATFTAVLSSPPTDGYFDIILSATETSAIPTTDKTDYSKKAKYTFDGELSIGGKVLRSFNGTVLVSPETTRIV